MAKTSTPAVPTEAAVDDVQATVARTRSPNYPVYRIEAAISKTQLLAEEFKRHRVPVDAAAKRIGFSNAKSSSASQAIAALKAYGFIDAFGSGDKRQVCVSEIGHKIVGNHSDRKALIAKAAIAPALHAELHRKFMTADGIAPDATIRQYLVFDRESGRFNEDVVDTFIRQFKETLAFAGLTTSDNMSEAKDEGDLPGVSVGDFVQWESQGVAQFVEPRQVTGLSDDGEWLFVEGSLTGIAKAEVQKVDPPAGKAAPMTAPTPQTTPATNMPPVNPNFRPVPLAAGTKQDVFTTDTGEVVVRWPAVLSAHDLEDIEGWLDMLKRKIKRSIKADTDEQN